MFQNLDLILLLYVCRCMYIIFTYAWVPKIWSHISARDLQDIFFIKYVNMLSIRKYVEMHDSYFNMQYNYNDMQENCNKFICFKKSQQQKRLNTC